MKRFKIPKERTQELLNILEKRFENNTERHPDINWKDVEKNYPKILTSSGL